MEIIIQPVLAGINDNTLNDLVNDVSREFEGIRVTIAPANDTTTMALQRMMIPFNPYLILIGVNGARPDY